jgi:hypothetical protein
MTGNKYRARADECFEVPDLMADPQRKLAHLDLARRRLRLAAQLDEMDAETGGRRSINADAGRGTRKPCRTKPTRRRWVNPAAR